jgi:hypothetical protein
MKKTFLPICLFIMLCGIYSCRKNQGETITDNNAIANRPERTNTVSPADINDWFNSYPGVKPAAVLLNAAQQAVINGQEVIRIPVATNAALYFTKTDGVLSVYAYKWIYTNTIPGSFSGSIDVYNFQTQQ